MGSAPGWCGREEEHLFAGEGFWQIVNRLLWAEWIGVYMAIAEVVKQCKTALAGYYGLQFKGLVLYGSAARGQAGPASDIDLLVLLSQPFDYLQELRRIVELLYPIQLDSDQLISAKPAPLDEFEGGSLQLYRNAKREGILL